MDLADVRAEIRRDHLHDTPILCQTLLHLIDEIEALELRLIKLQAQVMAQKSPGIPKQKWPNGPTPAGALNIEYSDPLDHGEP